VVERFDYVLAHWGSEQQEEKRYQQNYHTYLASRGDCHTHHVMGDEQDENVRFIFAIYVHN